MLSGSEKMKKESEEGKIIKMGTSNPNKKTIQFTVDIDEYRQIESYARAQERTVSNLAKYALKERMKRYPVTGVKK
jgi:hypothetical protein